MSRRTIGILLISFGIVLILAVLAWLLLPLFRKPATDPVVQPAPFEDTTTTVPVTQEPAVQPAPPIDFGQGSVQERQAQEALRRFAQEFTSRVGTYSNADQFGSLRQTAQQGTPQLQSYLEGVRQDLLKAHPPLQQSWGQTMRGLTSKIVSPLPLLNQVDASVVVQSQVVIQTPEGAQAPVYKEVTVSFTRNDPKDAWVVSRVEMMDL